MTRRRCMDTNGCMNQRTSAIGKGLLPRTAVTLRFMDRKQPKREFTLMHLVRIIVITTAALTVGCIRLQETRQVGR